MSEQHTTTVWASESDYDALESCLSEARVTYERSRLIQFSTDPTPYATIITISVVAIPALASVLRAYLKERKRRIVVAKPDGTKLIAETTRLGKSSGCSAPVPKTAPQTFILTHPQMKTPRPNQAMEPTTGRRTPKISMSRTSHPAATRALASGGSSCSR